MTSTQTEDVQVFIVESPSGWHTRLVRPDGSYADSGQFYKTREECKVALEEWVRIHEQNALRRVN